MANLIQLLQHTLTQKDALLSPETKRIILKEVLQSSVLDFLYHHPTYRRLNFYGGTCPIEDLQAQSFLCVSRVKGDIFTVAFLFIGCYGFYPDSVAPFGRVVPYIGVGPALIQSWASASGEASSSELNGSGNFNFNRTSTDIGLVADAGVRFMALKNVSLDVAFRYRWTQPNYDLFTVNTEGGPVKVKMGIRDAHLFNALVRANYHF